MKIKNLLILSASLLTLNVSAQSNTPVSFIHTVEGYFISHNPDLTNTFGATHKADIWTSLDSIQGDKASAAKLADAVGIAYTVYDHLSLENVLRTSGIAGTIVSDQFGVGLNFTVIDTRLTLYGDGGYNIENSHLAGTKFKDNLFGEVGIRVKKALTENTYAGIGLGVQLPNAAQVYQVVAGFTF